jgi:hypothetical protein
MYKILDEKLKGNEPFGRTKHNIKTDLREIGCKDML